MTELMLVAVTETVMVFTRVVVPAGTTIVVVWVVVEETVVEAEKEMVEVTVTRVFWVNVWTATL